MSGTEIAGNHLDTVSHQWNLVGYWVESVSGGGRYWNYDLTDLRAWPDNEALLIRPNLCRSE